MRARRTLATVLITTVVATAAVSAAPQDPVRVVGTDWLARHLRDPQLVLLHVGDKEEYAEGHIRGARFIELASISDPASLERGAEPYLELPTAAQLESVLAGLGISDDSRIVVYWGNDWVTPTTRVIFALDYFGLGDRVSILDGGMPAWRGAGMPLTDAMPAAPAKGLLHLTPHPEMVTDRTWIQQHLGDPGVAVVDCRSANFYATDSDSAGEMFGHIPGARSIPFTDIVDDELKIKPQEQLRSLFSEAGVQPGQEVVTYCHIGQQASLVRFAAGLLGYRVRFYDGSFHDWIAHRMPVEGRGGGRW